ncbi:MAG: hypothetical protein F6K45_26185, partial [Kamptonema sp. SIO1D9]|nr:hypothetical protein [Kamptonema sp. SIO1D9]
MNIDSLIAVGGFFMGILTSIGAGMSWYATKRADSATKEYAAKRDFQHLQRNLEQLNHGLTDMAKEQDTQLDYIHKELIELKSAINAALYAQTGETISGFLRQIKR